MTPGATTASSVSFTVAPQNADKCAYVCLKNVEGIELPDAVSVMAEGRQLEKVETQLVEVKELEAEAEYVVLAAASAGENAPVLSEPITLTTEKVNQGTTMEVTLAEGERTESTLSFTVTTANAAECRYRYFKKTEDFVLPDKYDIFATGDKVETSSPQEILLENLDDDTTYVIVAVVEAADSYDKEMSEPLEMTTLKRDKPENVDQQHFTEGELQVYSGGNNFYVKLTNDAYTVVLDLYDDYAKEKAPVIPAHEYSYLKGYHSNEPWVMASTSSVTAVSGAAFEIEKGSVNVGFADGAYTIVGSLISQDNKQLDIDYKGSLAFPVKLNSGKIEKSEKGYLAAFTGENLYGLNLEFITDKIAAGTYSFDNGTLGGNSALICGTTEYAVKAGSVELSLPSETNYVIKGELTTAEGYPLSLDVSIYGCDPARGAGRCDRLHIDLAGLCRSRCDGLGDQLLRRIRKRRVAGRFRVLQRRRYGFADSGLQISLLVLCRERNGLRHAIPHRQQEDFGDVDARRRIGDGGLCRRRLRHRFRSDADQRTAFQSFLRRPDRTGRLYLYGRRRLCPLIVKRKFGDRRI